MTLAEPVVRPCRSLEIRFEERVAVGNVERRPARPKYYAASEK